MRKLARLVLCAMVALTVAVPAFADHTDPCATDPILAFSATIPPGSGDGCTNPDDDTQHCDLWVQSDALGPGTCVIF